MKKKYEEELAKAREEFTKLKAEKEHFRVRNELLHDMSKIIVEQCLKAKKDTHEDQEEVEEDGSDDDIDSFANLMKQNKERGYRRVGPTEAPAKKKEDRNGGNNDAPKNDTRTRRKQNDTEHIQPNDDSYCHFYNNFNKCLFEDNTGKKCKFLHRKAPVCDFDGQCSRTKCMYQHKKQSSGRDSFLGPKTTTFTPHPHNWNPWMTPFPGRQMQNPWVWQQGKRNPQ